MFAQASSWMSDGLDGISNQCDSAMYKTVSCYWRAKAWNFAWRKHKGKSRSQLSLNTQDNAEASGKSLHYGNADVSGIDNLLIGRVVGVVQKQRADTCFRQKPGIRVLLSVPIISPSDVHSCTENLGPGQERILDADFLEGAADGHGNVHDCARLEIRRPEKSSPPTLNAVGVPQSHKDSMSDTLSGNTGSHAENPGGKTGNDNTCQGAGSSGGCFSGRPADQVHGHQCGEKADKNGGPEGRIF